MKVYRDSGFPTKNGIILVVTVTGKGGNPTYSYIGLQYYSVITGRWLMLVEQTIPGIPYERLALAWRCVFLDGKAPTVLNNQSLNWLKRCVTIIRIFPIAVSFVITVEMMTYPFIKYMFILQRYILCIMIS